MIELKHVVEFPQEIIAVDEVGRGPLGGPVVIGAIRISVESAQALREILKALRSRGIKDSKVLTSEDRLKILRKLGLVVSDYRKPQTTSVKGVEVQAITWDMDHDKIDELNILGASLQGMKEAALFFSEKKGQRATIFIDGPYGLRWGKEASPWTEVPIVKGDSKSPLIGLASILAKEKRDAHMRELHELYPQYGFDGHFGYPTPKHREAIKLHGPCPIHRKSFKGVREFLRA